MGNKWWMGPPKITFFSSLSEAVKQLGEREIYILLSVEKERVLVKKSSKGEIGILEDYFYTRNGARLSLMEGSNLKVVSPQTVTSIVKEMGEKRGLYKALKPLWVEKLKEATQALVGKEAIFLDRVHKSTGDKAKNTILRLLKGVEEEISRVWENEILERNRKSPRRVEGLVNRYKEVIGKFKILYPIFPNINVLEKTGLAHEAMDTLVLWRNPDPKEMRTIAKTMLRNSINELMCVEGNIEVSPMPEPEIVVVPYLLTPTPDYTSIYFSGFSGTGEIYTVEVFSVETVYLAKLEVSSASSKDIVYFNFLEIFESQGGEEEESNENKKIEVYRSYIREGDIRVSGKKEVELIRYKPLLEVNISLFFNEKDDKEEVWKREHTLEVKVQISPLEKPGINEGEERLKKRQTFFLYLIPTFNPKKWSFYKELTKLIDQVAPHIEKCRKVEVREALDHEKYRSAWYLSDRMIRAINYLFMALKEGKSSIIQEGKISLSPKSEGSLALAYSGLINSLVQPGLKERLVFGDLDGSLCFKEKESGERCSFSPLNVNVSENGKYKEIGEQEDAQSLTIPSSLGEEVARRMLSSVLNTPLNTITDIERIFGVIEGEKGRRPTLCQLLEKVVGKPRIREILEEGFSLHIAEKSPGKSFFVMWIEVDIYKEEERLVITRVVKPINTTVYLKTKEIEIRELEELPL